jgi:Putative auto-transporter adhesin, head GIN domain
VLAIGLPKKFALFLFRKILASITSTYDGKIMHFRIITFALTSLLIANTYANERVAQIYHISEVTGISAGGNALIEITQGDTESLRVEASPEAMRRVKVDLTNHQLTLGTKTKGGNYLHWFGDDKDEIRFVLQVKELRSFELTGAARATVGNHHGDALRVKNSGAAQTHFSEIHVKNTLFDISGASQVDIQTINSEKIDIQLSGASNLDVEQSSTAKQLMLEASGASNYRGKLLVASNAVAKASGASDIEINASETLNVDASGASTINYFGSAKVSSHSSGASDVNDLN